MKFLSVLLFTTALFLYASEPTQIRQTLYPDSIYNLHLYNSFSSSNPELRVQSEISISFESNSGEIIIEPILISIEQGGFKTINLNELSPTTGSTLVVTSNRLKVGIYGYLEEVTNNDTNLIALQSNQTGQHYHPLPIIIPFAYDLTIDTSIIWNNTTGQNLIHWDYPLMDQWMVLPLDEINTTNGRFDGTVHYTIPTWLDEAFMNWGGWNIDPATSNTVSQASVTYRNSHSGSTHLNQAPVAKGAAPLVSTNSYKATAIWNNPHNEKVILTIDREQEIISDEDDAFIVYTKQIAEPLTIEIEAYGQYLFHSEKASTNIIWQSSLPLYTYLISINNEAQDILWASNAPIPHKLGFFPLVLEEDEDGNTTSNTYFWWAPQILEVVDDAEKFEKTVSNGRFMVFYNKDMQNIGNITIDNLSPFGTVFDMKEFIDTYFSEGEKPTYFLFLDNSPAYTMGWHTSGNKMSLEATATPF